MLRRYPLLSRRGRVRARTSRLGISMSMPRSVLIFLGLGAASLMTLGTLTQAFAIPLADTRVINGCGTLIGSEGNGTAHLEANGDVTVTVNGQVRVNEDKDG